jgi:mRNA interferase MazF
VPGRAAPPRRGDIYLATLPEPVGRRPVLLVTRSAAIEVRSAVTVAPITRTIRGIPSEVSLSAQHGLKRDSVANCDSLQTIPKDALQRRLGSLSPDDRADLDRALRFALEIRAS